jgi:hypothetical protein
MTSPASEPVLDGLSDLLPSLTEYCNEKWAKLEAEGAPPSTRYRAEYMAAYIPAYLLSAVAKRAMLDEARRRFRQQGLKAVKAGDQMAYLAPAQMALPDIQAFILANHDRRLADAKSELGFVRAWCESNDSQYTEIEVYRSVGLQPPAES